VSTAVVAGGLALLGTYAENKKRERQEEASSTAVALAESPINAKAIQESSLGQYLESVNTSNTWLQKVQQTLGYEGKPITMLDAAYIGAGAVGFGTLFLGTLPALVLGGPLIAVAAVGASDPDRQAVITGGIAGTAAILSSPQTAAFVAKEAYNAAKSTVEQTIEVGKSGVGLLTAGIGLGSTILLATAVNKKRKREE
jgi:hypothetical protein